ncbi:zinc-binding dehydrogenase (plasmid) [Streptomyces mirabilis]|uniref:Zinc-binding dehydrogenase n=2 Tax=Streptomyces mirabilis TaxID=68239 RepID=A0ABU3V5L0_9ACTN|nr:zinc-binding dehydrogenase [Streptomyces mirabilis]
MNGGVTRYRTRSRARTRMPEQPRPLFQSADMDRQPKILTQVARLVDAGIMVSTATKDLGPVNAANLREAHSIMESGTAIGKITLTGF